ncbi:hypothetical protein L1887_31590 [Cichorium endivia]|nr:hypothetical protein L1887_31590 [Cichorium endivia]
MHFAPTPPVQPVRQSATTVVGSPVTSVPPPPVGDSASNNVHFPMRKGQTVDDTSEGLLEDCAQLVKGNSIQGKHIINDNALPIFLKLTCVMDSKDKLHTSLVLWNLFLYGYGATFNFPGILGTVVIKGPESFDILQGHSKATVFLLIIMVQKLPSSCSVSSLDNLLDNNCFRFRLALKLHKRNWRKEDRRSMKTMRFIVRGRKQTFLHSGAMRITFRLGVSNVHKDQLEGLLERVEIELLSKPGDLEAIKISITSGCFPHSANMQKLDLLELSSIHRLFIFT